MYKCYVGRIDQSNDSMINISWRGNLLNDEKIFIFRDQQIRDPIFSSFQVLLVHRNVNPDCSVDLPARILKHFYLLWIKTFVSQCRNFKTRPAVIELPSVITTLDYLAVIPSMRQRHAPVGTVVLQGKRFVVFVSSKNNTFPKDLLSYQIAFLQKG